MNSSTSSPSAEEKLTTSPSSADLVTILNRTNVEDKVSVKNVFDSVDVRPAQQGYCFTKRVTADGLARRYARAVSKAQERYIAALKEASLVYKSNIAACQGMDDVLGTNDVAAQPPSDSDDGNEEITVSTYGARRLKCPHHGCATATFHLKRHLVELHKLEGAQLDCALDAARRFATNAPGHRSADVVSKSARPTNTALVSRKQNYKECLLCKDLFMNMSDHIRNRHKITPQHLEYQHYVLDCETVPKCYTRKLNGKTVKLQGTELDEAQAIYSAEVVKQQDTLVRLKTYRKTIVDLQHNIAEGQDNSKVVEELCTVRRHYNQERFKDGREYTERVAVWRESFVKYLEMRGTVNPTRCANMAMDVLLPYEILSQTPITFNDIQNLRTIRQILAVFKDRPSTNSTSKIKYINQFALLVEFLVTDIESPESVENESHAESLMRVKKKTDILYELEKVKSLLSRDRGKDIIAAKSRAKGKLISDDENVELIAKTTSALATFVEAHDDGPPQYARSDALHLRDCLIAVATLRLGRRSKEMMTMTTDEVAAAEEKCIRGQTYHLIEVKEQKAARCGEAATVAFLDVEFRALTIYLQHLRQKILPQTTTNKVFICSNEQTAGELSFASIYTILKKFSTASGKAISSRTVRGSIVTNSRKQNLTAEQKQDLAKSMSHSIHTAERHYNYTETSDSVCKVLSSLSPPTSSSTPGRSTSMSIPPNISPVVLPDDIHQPSTSGIKRRLCFDDSSGDSALEETLQTLRSKKIKPAPPISAAEKCRVFKLLKKEVRCMLRIAKENKSLAQFRTKLGAVSVVPLTKALPRDLLKPFSQCELRECLACLLEQFE